MAIEWYIGCLIGAPIWFAFGWWLAGTNARRDKIKFSVGRPIKESRGSVILPTDTIRNSLVDRYVK